MYHGNFLSFSSPYPHLLPLPPTHSHYYFFKGQTSSTTYAQLQLVQNFLTPAAVASTSFSFLHLPIIPPPHPQTFCTVPPSVHFFRASVEQNQPFDSFQLFHSSYCSEGWMKTPYPDKVSFSSHTSSPKLCPVPGSSANCPWICLFFPRLCALTPLCLPGTPTPPRPRGPILTALKTSLKCLLFSEALLMAPPPRGLFQIKMLLADYLKSNSIPPCKTV